MELSLTLLELVVILLHFHSPILSLRVEVPDFRLAGRSLLTDPDGRELAKCIDVGWSTGTDVFASVNVLTPVMVHFPDGLTRGPFDRFAIVGEAAWNGSVLLAYFREATGGWRWAGDRADVHDMLLVPGDSDQNPY